MLKAKREKLTEKGHTTIETRDVSYLKEQAKLRKGASVTKITTGDARKDEMLGAVGFKNIGKALIDLPSTLDELRQTLKEVKA